MYVHSARMPNHGNVVSKKWQYSNSIRENLFHLYVLIVTHSEISALYCNQKKYNFGRSPCARQCRRRKLAIIYSNRRLAPSIERKRYHTLCLWRQISRMTLIFAHATEGRGITITEALIIDIQTKWNAFAGFFQIKVTYVRRRAIKWRHRTMLKWK